MKPLSLRMTSAADAAGTDGFVSTHIPRSKGAMTSVSLATWASAFEPFMASHRSRKQACAVPCREKRLSGRFLPDRYSGRSRLQTSHRATCAQGLV